MGSFWDKGVCFAGTRNNNLLYRDCASISNKIKPALEKRYAIKSRIKKSTIFIVARMHTKCYIWYMKYYDWDEEKNELLKKVRGICFEDVLYYLENDMLLDSYDNPNQKQYPGQKLYVVEIEGYAYLVPFVGSGDEIFLKTIIPSRKATKKYLRKGDKK
jgi:uncharacterized DUF497 family protein